MKKAKRIIHLILFSFLLTFPLLAYAGETTVQPTLTRQAALERALSYSPTLKYDEIDLEKKEYLRERAGANVRFTPTDISFSPSDGNIYSTYVQAQFAERQAKKKIENDKRQLVIDVEKTYNNILLAQQKLHQAQSADFYAQIKLLQATAQKSQGLLTEAEFLVAKTSVETAKTAVQAAQNELDNAYSNFNKLVNLDITSRPVLTDSISFQTENFDPESKANLAAECSYDSWSVEEAIDINEQIKIFAKYYNVGDWNVDQSKVTAADTKNLIKQQTRSLVLGMQGMEKRYNELTVSLTQAQEALKVTETKYKVGLATKDTVLKAQLDMEKVKYDIMDISSQYSQTRDTVLKLTGELKITI